MSQEDLNCSLVGVCDLFDVNADLAIDASNNEVPLKDIARDL